MRLLITFTLLAVCLTAIGQTSPTKKASGYRVDTVPYKGMMDHGQETRPTFFWNINDYIKYTDPTGKVVIIQNSGRRGGRGFTDARGIFFEGYRVFCTRVINEAATPLELTITFPADSFPLPSPDSYIKVFLLPDTMTHDYSVSDAYDARIKSYYEAGRHKLSRFQRTIKPKEAYLIHIVVLLHHNAGDNPQCGFFLTGQRLFYKIAPQFDTLIPCGQIIFKK